MSRPVSEPAEAPLPLEGAIVLPKRAPLWGALSLAGALVFQVYAGATYVSGVEARIRELEAGDSRMTARSDERYKGILERVGALEKGSSDTAGRLIRLEEQVRLGNDLLREIRDGLRAPAPTRR